MGKISTKLRRRLAATPKDQPVEVVVEVGRNRLAPPVAAAGRAEEMAARKKSFSATAGPIELAIKSSGGEVLDRAWLSKSLRARLSSEAVEALRKRKDVARLDMPEPLRSD